MQANTQAWHAPSTSHLSRTHHKAPVQQTAEDAIWTYIVAGLLGSDCKAQMQDGLEPEAIANRFRVLYYILYLFHMGKGCWCAFKRHKSLMEVISTVVRLYLDFGACYQGLPLYVSPSGQQYPWEMVSMQHA